MIEVYFRVPINKIKFNYVPCENKEWIKDALNDKDAHQWEVFEKLEKATNKGKISESIYIVKVDDSKLITNEKSWKLKEGVTFEDKDITLMCFYNPPELDSNGKILSQLKNPPHCSTEMIPKTTNDSNKTALEKFLEFLKKHPSLLGAGVGLVVMGFASLAVITMGVSLLLTCIAAIVGVGTAAAVSSVVAKRFELKEISKPADTQNTNNPNVVKNSDTRSETQLINYNYKEEVQTLHKKVDPQNPNITTYTMEYKSADTDSNDSAKDNNHPRFICS